MQLSRDMHSWMTELFFHQLPRHPLWIGAGEDECESTKESVEKFVVSKLPSKYLLLLFCLLGFCSFMYHEMLNRIMESTFPEVERDEAFTQKLADLQFITLAHVEIPAAFAQHESMFELAQVGLSFNSVCFVSELKAHLFVCRDSQNGFVPSAA
jgi:hypothetical protein